MRHYSVSGQSDRVSIATVLKGRPKARRWESPATLPLRNLVQFSTSGYPVLADVERRIFVSTAVSFFVAQNLGVEDLVQPDWVA